MDKIISIVPVSKGAEFLIKTTLGTYTVTPADFKKLSVSEGDELDEQLSEALEECALKLKCISLSF